MDSFNNNDPFNQFVKSKLSNYKADAPPFGWEKLESSLFVVQKTKTLHIKWIASSVAAVAAIFIGFIFVFHNMNKELPKVISDNKINQTISTSKKKDIPITVKSGTKYKSSTSSLIAEKTSIVQKSATDTNSSFINIQENDLSETLSIDIKDYSNINTVTENNTKNKKELTDNIDEEAKQKLIQQFINDGKRDLPSEKGKINKIKNRNSISLTGQSGLLASQNNNILPSTLRTSLDETYGSYTLERMNAFNDIEKVEQESKTYHTQPLSFGVLTSFALSSKLYIETGVVYTYLSSETTNKSDDFKNSENVQFHYLGVPLNLNYTILKINKLDVFVTAGGMIEKDIYGKIKYSDEKKMQTVDGGYATNSLTKIKQRNPQFSLAGGVGISYPLYDKTKLFGKVGGRYYFDAKNEYKTFYTDEKFGLDLQLGIKFNF